MTIENRDLAPGTKLVARYKGQEYTAQVVESLHGEGTKPDGIRYVLPDGRQFKSPSAAGSAVMGGSACNGWRFWSLAGEEPTEQPKKAKKAAGKKPAQNGLIERMEDGRFFCSACQEAFDAPEGIEPQGCPNGHVVENPEAE